jgi:cytochrome c553
MFHTKINTTAGFVLIALLTTASAFAQSDNTNSSKSRTGDPASGKAKSLLCQGCHGEDGNSLATLIPKLAGQNSVYISKQVHNFQSGTRVHGIMNGLAATVSDDDLVDIAAYFASLAKMKGDGSGGNQTGKDLFLNGNTSRKIASCVSCHGVNGKGLEPNPAMIPLIGGQHKDYLLRQLGNFRKGDRSNSPDGVMNGVTKSLTDAELESLAGYISGL